MKTLKSSFAVAEALIRLRILKEVSQSRENMDGRGGRGIDPFEDTERRTNSLQMRLSMRRGRGIDPFEDTESFVV